MKKKLISLFIVLLIAYGSLLAPLHSVFSVSQADNSIYHVLEPLPCDSSVAGEGCDKGQLKEFDTSSSGSSDAFGKYLNVIIRLFIGLCAVLAVVMIVIGG